MSIKIVFVDIDWTLLDHDSNSFDEKSINSLKKIKNDGVLVYLCTARPYQSVEQLGILNLLEPDGVISTNGGLAFYKNQLIFKNVFPLEITRNFIEVCKKNNLVVEYCTEKERFLSREPNEFCAKYFSTFNEKFCNIKEYENEEVTSLLLMCPSVYDDEVKNNISSQLEYLRFSDYGVDVRYVRNNKGLGIQKVLKFHNLTPEEALSLGDDFQDIFMFINTKYSAYVGEGKEEIEKHSLYKAGSIKSNGVHNALVHFGLI